MNKGLKRIAFFIGMGILGVSIFWSQDGFNFDVAGSSGYGTLALAIGWFLAIAFSCLQFVFSSNFKELNMSLILLGMIAYGYSIYTNYAGIVHFQGNDPNTFWSWALAFFLDASAEPLIAWSLGVSREGDFLGNIIKTIAAFFNGIFEGASESRPRQEQKAAFQHKTHEKPVELPKFGGKSSENGELHALFPTSDRRSSGKKPNLHGVKPNRAYFDE